MEPRTPAEWKTLFESEAFARQTEYYGPLGVEYTPAGTHLRLWAPTAKQAAVNLYRRGTGGACVGTLPLQQQDKGVWSVYLPGDQHGKYYDFTLTTPFGTCNAADPYARSAGVNGVRSMIFDPARVDPQGWERDVRPVIPPQRVGGRRPGFLAGPGQRRAHSLAGQIPGLYPAGHDPEQRRHPPHLPELPQAAGGELCPTHAHLRFWQRGREPPPDPAV